MDPTRLRHIDYDLLYPRGMSDAELAKEFVKRWARLTDHLYTCQAGVLSELVAESGARQQAQILMSEKLGSPEERRAVAMQLALATSRAPSA